MSWSAMVQRTTNFAHKNFSEYADYVNPLFLGKGGFVRFLGAVGPRPSVEYTLDRIDCSKGYEIGNMRWALKPEQERNKIRKQYYGRTTEEWAAVLGVRPTTVRKRMERGWTHAHMFPAEYRLCE